ncbi:MAG: DNA polymerase I [Candidatus Kerfeldbacteria bacterium RIFCSPHIGHO2_12_FULL_48_17]|uniref:DNA polymerase I n=1 Tax=Candidatus Kerfeldbacteria bacterium RIFCSPHIGHO2_12_FULL_48_17 TaxID=1798542 RepID=A0A1G2B193_9BACT|nr:MAG: DNA polymerase I [Candidatus Kerfeldbacteria bacterium RIFCSPHIGHO2_12_FULL_48_17]
MAKRKEKFVIIDGHALIHRAFHALPPLTTKKGEIVNAIYGFTSILLKVVKELRPEYLVVTFDAPGGTFRHEEYKEYKATRKKQADELYEQIPKVVDMVRAFGIPTFEQRGVEADDLIGTLKTRVIENTPDVDVVIVTGDMDTLQLVDHRTTVQTMKTGVKELQVYDEAAVRARYGGLRPAQMIDYKALRGDPSDNIPGVRGIGEKGAIHLLVKYGDLAGVYKHLDELPAGLADKLREHKKDADMSRWLATIKLDVPVKLVLSEARFADIPRDAVVKLFQRYEFKSLLAQLLSVTGSGQSSLFATGGDRAVAQKRTDAAPSAGDAVGGGGAGPAAVGKKHSGTKPKQNYILVDTADKLKDFTVKLKQQKIFAVDTETTGLNPFEATLLGMSFAWKSGQAYYVLAEFAPQLKSMLENPAVKKVGHNIKFDMESLRSADINMQGIFFDTMIASYLLNPGSRAHGLDRVVFTEIGYEMMPITDLIGKGKKQLTLDQVAASKVAWYAAEDADYTWQLYTLLAPQLKAKHVDRVMEDIDMPLVPVLADMERYGVKIDSAFLQDMSKTFARKITQIEKKIYSHAGKEFNIASPLQLKEILFERLKLPTHGISKTKTGYSTGADELEKLRTAHPIIPLISQYREYTKLKSTYIDALPLLVSKKTGRLHTSFNQTIAATGRLSSTDPNLQNIPIRTELGRAIRQAFVAERGFTLVAADYSQIELRIVASLAGDKEMLATFKRGEDIHTATAAYVHGLKPAEVTKDQRRAAKAVNFGILYGMGAYGIARDAGISREEAAEFLERYLSLYSGVKKYLDRTLEEGRKRGYTETVFGRRRYLPELNSGMRQVRAAAERMAVNMPVQGTEADIVKLAMIAVAKWLARDYTAKQVRMLLQVHDELVFEVETALVPKFAAALKKIMEGVYKLKCPMVVDLHAGKNWDAMDEIF